MVGIKENVITFTPCPNDNCGTEHRSCNVPTVNHQVSVVPQVTKESSPQKEVSFIKAPIHFLQEIARNGQAKPIALFLSLKKIYGSGHIWDWKKVDLTKIGYTVSRPTYLKYVRALERMRLVWSDGKGGMVLAGQNKILKLYPITEKQKLKYVYLPNDKTIRENIEKVVLKQNIESQEAMIRLERHKKLSGNNTMMILCTKTVGGQTKNYTISPQCDTSISNKTLANIIGLNSFMTGYRRQRKWSREGFIDTYNRKEVLGSIREQSVQEKLRQPIRYTIKDGIAYKYMSNEVHVKDRKFGRKVVEVVDKNNPNDYYVLRPLFLENW